MQAVPPFAELVARTAFTFREGASLPEEMAARAAELGLAALGICDEGGVYGLVRAWRAGRARGLRILHGAALPLAGADGGRLGVLPLLAADARGWAALCRVLTRAAAGRPKGEARLPLAALAEDCEGLVALPGASLAARPEVVDGLAEAFGDRLAWVATRHLRPHDARDIERVETAARRTGRPVVAANAPLTHDPRRQRLQDVLRCIRHGVSIDRAGRRLEPNAERHLKGPAAMGRLFADRPRWVARTVEIAERCTFELGQLRYVYPREVVPEGHTPASWLRELVARGCRRRWPGGVPERVRRQLEHELDLIERLDFPAYFLTVHDIVALARRRGILCQGRGSAANSAVCYALGITAVDPARSNLLFERFISPERGEPPDIDVDFEHERREEVIQAVYERYGRERAAMVDEVIAWRPRSALRDVGKALGLSLEQVDRLARAVGPHRRTPLSLDRVAEAGLDPDDPRVRLVVELAAELQGFPRHVGIHVGGFVIAEGRLTDRCPVEPAAMEGRTVIQWDKDDVDAVGFVKVDLLALGMLTAIRKAFDLVARHHGRRLELATIPPEDPAVYAMLRRADSVGVFQVESRAQQSMLPRLKPRCFYDLVIQVSIVRPGPIQGGMVHPYLARRAGREPVEYAHPALRPILERTLGIPIFQEQVMEMAVAVGGFTPGEADELRRAMGSWRKRGGLERIVERLVDNMTGRGIDPAYAARIARQILGFGEYGFPESHAASFALLVYASAWLKRYAPAAFCAALLNAWPMGFYSPASLVADARRHGVEVRPVCVAASSWDCTLEPDGRADPTEGGSGGRPFAGMAVRLGLRSVRGLPEADARRLLAERERAPFADLPDLLRRTRLGRRSLEALARADALAALGTSRREALWTLRGAWGREAPLLAGQLDPAPSDGLPAPTPVEELALDLASARLSLRHHPTALVRRRLARQGVLRIADLAREPDGARVRVAGVVTHRQRPGTASGVVFLSLEDESGIANLVVWPRVYERHRRVAGGENLLVVTGRLQRQDEALSVLATGFEPLDLGEPAPSPRSRDFR